MKEVLIVEPSLKIRKLLYDMIINANGRTLVHQFESFDKIPDAIWDRCLELFIINITNDIPCINCIRSKDVFRFTPVIVLSEKMTDHFLLYTYEHVFASFHMPFDRNMINDSIKSAMEYVAPKVTRNRKYIINMRRELFQIEIDDIVYLKSVSKNVVIFTKADCITISGMSLKHFLENTDESRFVYCHRGFCVNVNHIKMYDSNKNCLILSGTDENIPVSKMYRKTIKEICCGSR